MKSIAVQGVFYIPLLPLSKPLPAYRLLKLAVDQLIEKARVASRRRRRRRQLRAFVKK